MAVAAVALVGACDASTTSGDAGGGGDAGVGDLRGADFAGVDFAGFRVDLGGADLSGIDLAGASTDLAGAGFVDCKGIACNLSLGEVCCVTSPQQLGCAASPCPAGTTTAACDGPDDCAGAVCCGMTGDTTFTSACAASCGAGQSTACHSTADCPAAASHCCPDPQFPIRFCTAAAGAACN